jgi:hypothetical protein
MDIDIEKIEQEMIDEANNREYAENQLKVDIDWSSTGLWIKIRNNGWANTYYENYDLPQWLVDRFNYWTELFNAQKPETINKDLDLDQFEAYGTSLAIDLKRVLGKEYDIYYGSKAKKVVL